MQLPSVLSYFQEREAGSHALEGAGSLCMYSACRHPLCTQLPAPEGQIEERGRGRLWCPVIAAALWTRAVVASAHGEVFPGPEFSWEWLVPRLQTSPHSLPRPFTGCRSVPLTTNHTAWGKWVVNKACYPQSLQKEGS